MTKPRIDPNDCCVYEHWRPDTNVCFYVGKGRLRRAVLLKRTNVHHRNIRQKLHVAGFEVEVKIISRDLSDAAALALEIERIAFWRNLGVVLANKTDGGLGVTGYQWPEYLRNQARGRNGYWTGKKRSPETIAKISAAKTGKTIRLSEYGVEQRRKNIARATAAKVKPVVCVTTGEKFSGAIEAAAKYCLCRTSVCAVCGGKRNSVYGLVFRYADSP